MESDFRMVNQETYNLEAHVEGFESKGTLVILTVNWL